MSHVVGTRDLPRFLVVGLLSVTGLLVWVAGYPYLLGGVPYGNDNSSHLAWMIHIAKLLQAGQTDFFFEQQNLGVPMFLAYQPLPGLFMGTIHALSATWISAPTLFKGSILLLWSCMPVSWYVGGRWMGMSRTAAVILGLLVLGIHDAHDYGLTFQSVAYRGLYSQLYGMFFLPLALGSIYRYLVLSEGPVKTPVLFFWLTFLSHAFFGIYLGIASFLMMWVRWDGFFRRWGKLVLVYSLTGVLLLFWIIPLGLHLSHVGGLPWKKPIQEGLPWLTALQQWWTGSFLDHERWLWLTGIVGFGMLVALLRIRDRLSRWVLLLFVVTFVLFLGRTQWGGFYDLLPFHRELNVARYVVGLHACSVLLAALGLEALLQRLQEQEILPKLSDFLRKWSPLVLVAVAGFYIHNRFQHWGSRLTTFSREDAAFDVLTRYLAKFPDSRFVAHENLGTTSHLYRDYLAAAAERPHLQSYGMTFHATLGTFFVENFDFSATHCHLYGVRHLVARDRVLTGKAASVYKQVQRIGPYRVYEFREKTGMFGFVRIPLTVVGEPKAMRRILQEIMTPMFAHRLLPLLQVVQRDTWLVRMRRKWETPVPVPTFHTPGRIEVSADGSQETMWLYGKRLPPQQATTATWQRWLRTYQHQKIPSLVLSEHRTWNAYHARVEIRSLEDVLVLKVNDFPYWQAYAGEKRLHIFRVAPNYMAVHLPKGTHAVRFVYNNPRYQKLLFVLSICWALLLAFVNVPLFRVRSETPDKSKPSPQQGGQRSTDPVGDWIEQHYKKPPT